MISSASTSQDWVSDVHIVIIYHRFLPTTRSAFFPAVAVPQAVEVLRLYPEYQQEFSNDIQHDLTFNLREGYEAEAEESDVNAPSLALPSISEDDENQSDAEHATGSPRTSAAAAGALLRSPLLAKNSPRRKFLQRESSLSTLRERVERQRSVTVKTKPAAEEFAEEEEEEEETGDVEAKSLDGMCLDKSDSYVDVSVGQPKQFDRLDSLHQDVAALSIEVRNAIQALQEVTYSRMASNVQLCGFPPARSIPNLGGLNGVEIPHESEIVRSSSHPPEMWGRQIFALHPDNPFQADIDAVLHAKSALVVPAVTAVATQTEEALVVKQMQGPDLLRLVEETIMSNPEILLLMLRKHDGFARCSELRKLAHVVLLAADDHSHPHGSKVELSRGRAVASMNKGSGLVNSGSSSNCNNVTSQESNGGGGGGSGGSRAASIINHSVQYYEEAEQKLLCVKNKLRRKMSSEKVRRRNHYNDSSRVNGLPSHRFSAGDADYAEPEGVRANHSTRSLKDN